MPITLGIATYQPLKYQEFQAHFKRYGVRTIQVTDREEWEAQLRDGELRGVLSEQTELWSETRQRLIREEPADFEPVIHRSRLDYMYMAGEELKTQSYQHETRGTIDLSRSPDPLPEDCYHWDGVFVVDQCDLSLYEIKQRTGQKTSSRDLNISAFIKEHIHFTKRRDLHHRPQHLSGVVDFDTSRAVKTLCSLVHSGSKMIALPLTVLNQGVFLRSAHSRRSSVYWCPGLNAGLPLIPKPKDPMHEKTFMFHDVIHFTVPDLIFDGVVSPLHKLVYVAHRISSELISLVVADMLYVAQSQEPYPTAVNRRILPLYEALGVNPDPREILKGAFRYGFYGDDAHWRDMITRSGGDIEALSSFREKYDAYISEDFKWTLHNWAWMSERASSFKAWWGDFGEFVSHQSISQEIKRLGLNTLELNRAESRDVALRVIFDAMVERVLGILEGPTPKLNARRGRQRAIDHYLVGQALIFYRYDSLHQNNYFKRRMLEALRSPQRPPLENLRAFYAKYLSALAESRLINPDDEELFQEFYPIFDFTLADYRTTELIDPLSHLTL